MTLKSVHASDRQILESAGMRNPLAILAVVEPCGDTWRVFVAGRLCGTHFMRNAAIDQAIDIGRQSGCTTVTVLPFSATEHRQVLPITP